MDDFGGRGAGRMLGPDPRKRPDRRRAMGTRPLGREEPLTTATPTPQLTEEAGTQAAEVIRQGGQPAVVHYKAPSERANDAARRAALSVIVALAVPVLPLLIAFLQSADFTRNALIALGTSVATAVLTTALAWALKFREATADDAPPLDGGAEVVIR